MKNYLTYGFAFYFVFLITNCASSNYETKNKSLNQILAHTKQTINSLATKIPATEDKKLLKAYQNLEKKYQELAPVLEKCNEKYALTTAYMTTLKEAQKTLQRIDKNFKTISNKTFTIDAIYQDFDAKLQSIHKSAKSDANTKVRVIINSNKDEGFFVFGKLSYERDMNIKRFRFNKPTQNAVQDFVPGYYLFWLEKEHRIGEPELHLIMSSEEEEKQLVLKTPK